MCKSKKKMTKQVIEPTKQPPSAAAKSSPPPRKSKKSQQYSSSGPSYSSGSDNFVLPSTASTSTFLKDSWVSSTSAGGGDSLTTLRESILKEQPHIYDFQEICAATRNFSLKPHSSSTSAAAWRCSLRGESSIIFRRRFRRQMDTAELVDRLAVICKSHHSSLVRLKGASISDSYIYLVYDFIPGASLSDCLRNPKNPNFTVLSNWMSRIRIASDVAHGLDYIHHSTGLGFGFVHNHIKSSSIVVVEGTLNAKICHFGTSELCGEVTRDDPLNYKELTRSNSKTKKFEGTRGYMAPEFQRSGVSTQECDVYAFGIVILELISGMEALNYRVDEESGGYVRISVVDAAREAVGGGEGGVRRWVDKRLRDSFPVEVVEKLARLALDCVADEPENRPDMGKVVMRISQMFLESQDWVEKMGVVDDFTVSLAPR